MDCKLCRLFRSHYTRMNGQGFPFLSCCELDFRTFRWWLSPEKEKARYREPWNGADNPDYVRYLTNISHEIDRFPLGIRESWISASGPEYVLTRCCEKGGVWLWTIRSGLWSWEEHLYSQFDIVVICRNNSNSMWRDIPQKKTAFICGAFADRKGYISFIPKLLSQ